jgi:hypothetical protein
MIRLTALSSSTATHPQTGGARKFSNNPRFMNRFRNMLQRQGRARSRAPVGTDMARSHQALAGVLGKRSTGLRKRTAPAATVNPVSASLEHSVRNRAVEQGANTVSAAAKPTGVLQRLIQGGS